MKCKNFSEMVIKTVLPMPTRWRETILRRTLTTEYPFIRYIPLWEPEGSSRMEMRGDPERASGKHPPESRMASGRR